MAQSRVKIGQNWLKIAQNRPKMPQNRPKIVLRGQNKHPQNTADRKLRPNTPQGAVYAILVRPLGRRVPNLATKGPKGPICCQIWNGFKSIGSVFRSSVPPNASCDSQNGLKSAQRDSKWLQIAQNRPKMAQSRVKIAQSGSKWLKVAQNGPKWPKMAQNGSKWAQNGGH